MSDASDTRSIVQTDLAISVRTAAATDAPALAALINRAYSIESFFVDGDRTNAVEIERMLYTLTLGIAHRVWATR